MEAFHIIFIYPLSLLFIMFWMSYEPDKHIWYWLNKRKIKYQILNFIYQFLYVDIRPTSFGCSCLWNSIITDYGFHWGVPNQPIEKPEQAKIKKGFIGYSEDRKYYNLTQFDAHIVRQEIKKRVMEKSEVKNEKKDFDNIQYYGAFITHINNINPLFKFKIKTIYKSKFKYRIVLNKINLILNELESDGFIYRNNGVLFENDIKGNLKYNNELCNENEGYFNLTKRGLDFICGNKDISLSNNEVIKNVVNTIISNFHNLSL